MNPPLIPSRPRRALEQIKGISEQKASKLLAEGMSPTLLGFSAVDIGSIEAGPYGLHNCH